MVNLPVIGSVSITAILLALSFIGWAFTLYRWRQSLQILNVSLHWWVWWGETAVRHHVNIGEDDVNAARELVPEDGPTLLDQIERWSDDPEGFCEDIGMAPDELDWDSKWENDTDA